MKTLFFRVLFFWVAVSVHAEEIQQQPNQSINLPQASQSTPEDHDFPASLREWKGWATWEDPRNPQIPLAYDSEKQGLPVWASSLALSATERAGTFEISATAYESTWLRLPGNHSLWPQAVMVDGEPVAVVARNQKPAIRLSPGSHSITGTFPWEETPQRIAIPNAYGVLTLSMNGQSVDVPNWDAEGFLWLKRAKAEAAEREFLEAKIYRVLEDGIPMWLRTEIELSVAGKSREEALGMILPQAGGPWTIAGVNSKLPCAVDDDGQVKVQVRAGKWTVQIDAFRAVPADTIGYAEGITPIAEKEVIAFRSKPDFRVLELSGIQAVDVSQTTLPKRWRDLPVYRWDTATSFKLEEKMRGMGFQRPSGLTVVREFWLDDDGGLMTFRDMVSGASQQVWRLDVSPGQKLGAARVDGEGQLITSNPTNGASGLEIRKRNINFEAVGRIENPRKFPASGWVADVESCRGTLHLPPGWRVFALFGAESVQGDWLTSWTLLDLFLLLIFCLAVLKLWGWIPAVIAALGLGMTFHESGAPLVAFFILLVPAAIIRALPKVADKKWIHVWKYLAIALLLIGLLPFITKQIQGVLYPQLENGSRTWAAGVRNDQKESGYYFGGVLSSSPKQREGKGKFSMKANMKYDAQAQIQTGPAIPQWKWRKVNFSWRGPVTSSEMVKVMLIPPAVQRIITVTRVLMLILLVGILLGSKRFLPPILRGKSPSDKPPKIPKIPVTNAAAVFILSAFLLGSEHAVAETFPSDKMLEQLKERLNVDDSPFSPFAAEIPHVSITLENRKVTMVAEVHANTLTAVPLPGRLPSWSPVTVLVNGEPAEALARRENFLWVALDPGTHMVQVEGLLPNVTEWEWGFLLKPRYVEVDAEGWTVTGIKPGGIPENEVFFAIKTPAAAAEAAYDRKDFNPAILIEREIEVGLVWQVRTTLKRLSQGGKAVSLPIPLLPGERVLSSHFLVNDGMLQARLGTGEQSLSWESELVPSETLNLESSPNGNWVEQWRLIASPVWNVQFSGLPPVYKMGDNEVQPVWRPWPGESAELRFSKPKAIPGATMTVRGVKHTTNVGLRQRVSALSMRLQASLGQELAIDLDPEADVTALRIQDAEQPVRRDGSQVIIPVRPGEQKIDLEWKTPRRIGGHEAVDSLTLPVESSNISTALSLPSDRWVLWTHGPLRGPAVRFWALLIISIIGAVILGRVKHSPLRSHEWALLALGLTQVYPILALGVVAWFFILSWRGTDQAKQLPSLPFNLLQLVICFGIIPVAGVLLFALHKGLLGTPEMMVSGNGSTANHLKWFAQRADGTLPIAGAISVSIWFYRLLMLAWALWLAAAVLRWIKWGWTRISGEPLFKKSKRKQKVRGGKEIT